MDAKLLGTIIERVKNIAGIEAFLVLTMAAFHLAVVPGSIGTDEFVTNTQALRSRFKQSGYIPNGWYTHVPCPSEHIQP